MVLGADIAATTTNIRIGQGVTVMPFRQPVNLAEQIAMLDVVSNGSLDVGVDRAYQAIEYRAFDLDMGESRLGGLSRSSFPTTLRI